MTLEPDPFEILKELSRLGERFLKDMKAMDLTNPVPTVMRWGKGAWPSVDLAETATELIVVAEIPGLRQSSDIKIELRGNVLTLEGEAGSEPPGVPSFRLHQQELKRGKFKRSITLPVPVKGAQATYQRGILEVHLAKIQGSQPETLKVEFVR